MVCLTSTVVVEEVLDGTRSRSGGKAFEDLGLARRRDGVRSSTLLYICD